MMKSNPQSIHCGSADDNFEALKKTCETEASKLSRSLIIESGKVVEIPFWTNDIPELICIGKFALSDKGIVEYELDFSESTL